MQGSTIKKIRYQIIHRRFRTIAFAFVALIVASISIIFPQLDSIDQPLETGNWFTQEELGRTFHLFDIGVANINDDNFLDIFTVNHSARQSVLINQGHNKFQDELLTLGLNQNPEIPGISPSDIKKEIKSTGIYIYWDKAKLVIEAHKIDKLNSVTGHIQLPQSVSISTYGNANVLSQESPDFLALDFTLNNNDKLTIESRKFFFTSTFQITEKLPLNQIFLGSEQVKPSSHEFIVRSGKDRHGMAWADFNGDGKTDVFVMRGGEGGRLEPDPLNKNDELLLRQETIFEDKTLGTGIFKEACPGRRVSLVDFDGDNQLDIYVGCGREKPPRKLYPNQLHRQVSKGKFINVAEERGLAIQEEGPFIWLDADNDQDLDLLLANENSFFLYINNAGYFKSQIIGDHAGKVRQLTTADFDNDGDFDIFAASDKTNALLISENNTYKIINPEEIGLPTYSSAASWLDYDNDGLTDIYFFPNGIYHQKASHKFEKTHLLERKFAKIDKIFCSWFDADNDGKQDLVLAVKVPPTLRSDLQEKALAFFKRKPQSVHDFASQDKSIFTLSEWKVILYRNVRAQNHWLQVQVTGTEGNQAGLGTKVEIETENGIQIQQIGQTDGANRSKGHYRNYFGLGAANKVKSIRFFWANAQSKEVNNIKVNRLLNQTIELQS